MSKPTFVDFNGLGAFMSYGFIENGMEMVHRTGTLDFGNVAAEANRHLLGSSWETSFGESDAWNTFRGADVVMGLPPCSGWSCWSGPSNRGPDAKAHSHTRAFMEYTGRVEPIMAVFECVQQAFTQGREVMLQYRDMVEDISGIDYDLHHVKMNNLMVGGFSYRPRYFFVLIRKGLRFGTEYEWPETVPSIMDVIGDLADLPDTWEKQNYRYPSSPFLESIVSPSGVVDGHKRLDNIHNERIDQIFEYLEKDGEDWQWGEGLSMALKRLYELQGTLPPLWANKQQKIVKKNFDMGFSLPYRWRGDAWANVLTGGALDLVVHPTRARCITHREAARIQGLPDDWLIKPTRGYGALQSVWGKAVSRHAGRWMGRWVKAALDGRPGEIQGVSIGDREWLHETDKGFSRQKARVRYFPDSKAGISRAYDPELWPSAESKAAALAVCELE